ncbi:MAG: hypothetical protein CMH57_04565 [Myxococcales bacterium]|nr:hypothetical protein [Myxococcales bacterium]
MARSPEHMLGLMNLRGRLLPLVSLRRVFAMEERPLEDHNRVIVVTFQGLSVGVVVDQVREVLRVSDACRDAVPQLLNRPGEEEVIAICRLEEGKRLLSVLSAAALFEQAAAALEEHIHNNAPEEAVMEHMESYGEGEETQLVVFQLAGQEYGVSVEAVQEITRVPEQVTVVPRTPSFIEGLINLRGTILPVIDMRQRFSFPPMGRSDRQRILVLNLDGVRTGFITDSVSEVLRLSSRLIEESPRISEHQARLMGRVANLKEGRRMIQVLNVDALLDEDEQRQLAQVAA